MNDSDGHSTTPLPELIMDSIQSSEAGEVTIQTQSPQSRTLLGEFKCRTAAFLDGGDKPHFLFSSAEGWGRFYLTDTQIALIVEDCSKYIGNLVRASKGR